MKNKLRALREAHGKLRQCLAGRSFVHYAVIPFKWLWGVLSHNLALKLLSLLLAILLWDYVISSNTSITRAKTLSGITGYVSGQSTLSAYRLAMLEDPTEALKNISVTVEAPQSSYANVSGENVQVTLDLSRVRTAGTQQVPLKAVTTYGQVTAIVPASVTLTFDTLDTRNVRLRTKLIGDMSDDYLYTARLTDAVNLSISGARSVVRSISAAYVNVDVTDVQNSISLEPTFVLVDEEGQEISQAMLDCHGYTTIPVELDVYPKKEVAINSDIGTVVAGKPLAGYEVKSVTLDKEKVMVAADGDTLDNLQQLLLEPVNVRGADGTINVQTKISVPSDIQWISDEAVSVTVTIGEETAGERIDIGERNIVFTGVSNGINATAEPTQVYVTGPRSLVEQLKEKGVDAMVDVTGLGEGDYQLIPSFNGEMYPNVEFTPEAVHVTITASAHN